ncbi:MAG TPA: IS1595 family transposase [Alphaproteobacteria bacterium]|nr:IS1595 family transposase [Alphaproteobacteria bacterium]
MLDLKNPIYGNDEDARKHLEALRWPNGPSCPHCEAVNNATELKGGSTRAGVWKCKACRKPFSVTVGTVFERSHIPLSKWLLATHLLSASKKGMSAHQLHRMLDVTYKTAWFMAHRIREAMKDEGLPPLGGEGKTLEMDETYFGRKAGEKGSKRANRRAVVSLVERGGDVRSFHVKHANSETVKAILKKNADKDSVFNTDEFHLYDKLGKQFVRHDRVKHSDGEYVRGEAYTNTIEGYFSIFKRGMRGVYQHCGEQHLQRYLAEFDFRYNHRKIADDIRAAAALKNIEGKRLTYRRSNEA